MKPVLELNQDSIELKPGAANNYSYSTQNPIIYTGPSGEWIWIVWVAGGLVVVITVEAIVPPLISLFQNSDEPPKQSPPYVEPPLFPPERCEPSTRGASSPPPAGGR